MIEKLRSILGIKNPECRFSESAESIIDHYFPVLDQGFVALKDYLGNDSAIERSARVSYGKGTRKVSETRGLIRYLLRNKHTSPLEQVELTFHVRVPMDCWRQWIRHRMSSTNEYSTRYSVAINSNQETNPSEWRSQAQGNKQGSGDYLEEEIGVILSSREVELQQKAREVYEERIDKGVAREQARKDLPLSTYTEAYWKIDLHNLFHFLKLRCDSHAQWEIRQYANIMAGMAQSVAPLAFEGWYDYVFQASNFTRLDKVFLDILISNYQNRFGDLNDIEIAYELDKDTLHKEIGMSDRELAEFWAKFRVPDPVDFTLDINKAKPYTYFEDLVNGKA